MDEAGAIEGRCVCRVADMRGFLLIDRGGLTQGKRYLIGTSSMIN